MKEEKDLINLTPVAPKKVHKVDTIQPNSVTTARYSFNSVQEDILTLMYSAIQDHLSTDKNIQTDLFGNPQITFNYRKVKSGKNKQQYITHAQGMINKSFEFDYTNKENKIQNVKGALVTTVIYTKDERDPNITLVINTWAIPYLLYWGKGVGGTTFSAALSLSLRSVHTKVLYKICCQHRRDGGFGKLIEDFKKDLKIKEGTYNDTKSFKKLLTRAQTELKEKSNIYFEFKLLKKGGSKVYNWINFKVITKEGFVNKVERTDMWTTIFSVLSFPYPSVENDKAMRIADNFAETPELQEKFYRRCKKLRDEFDDGKLDKQDVIKLVKYILKDDYGIN